jgi:hypothetical protein
MHVKIRNVLITQKNQRAFLFVVIVEQRVFLTAAAKLVEHMLTELLQPRKLNKLLKSDKLAYWN